MKKMVLTAMLIVLPLFSEQFHQFDRKTDDFQERYNQELEILRNSQGLYDALMGLIDDKNFREIAYRIYSAFRGDEALARDEFDRLLDDFMRDPKPRPEKKQPEMIFI